MVLKLVQRYVLSLKFCFATLESKNCLGIVFHLDSNSNTIILKIKASHEKCGRL